MVVVAGSVPTKPYVVAVGPEQCIIMMIIWPKSLGAYIGKGKQAFRNIEFQVKTKAIF